MRMLRVWCCALVSALLWFGATAPRRAQATILINEVYANPIGTDDNREFIELKSSTGGVEAMTGLVLLLIDSNGGNTGNVDDAYSLNNYSTGTNGLLMMGNDYDVSDPGPLAGPWNAVYDPATVLKDPSGAPPFTGLGVGDLSNNALSVLLVRGFSGAAGTDLDTNDDGVFDATPWLELVDSVGWRVGTGGVNTERTYALANLSNGAFTPDTAARINGDNTPNSAAAWYGGDLSGDLAYDPAQNFGLPAGAAPTPGSINHPVPEPATWLLALFAAAGLICCGRRFK